MIAEKEFIVDNQAARLFFNKAGSHIKSIVEFKDAYHELQKEPNKDQVFTEALKFIGS
jgi:alpha-beta hydrolase superfamily lysophospholipase